MNFRARLAPMRSAMPIPKLPKTRPAPGTASRLGLKRTTLITRMKKLGIDPNTVSHAGNSASDTSDASDTSQVSASSLAASSAE